MRSSVTTENVVSELCVRESPHPPRCEFLILWIEVTVMHDPSQLLGRSSSLSMIDDQLRHFISKLSSAPSLDLAPHRLEVPLHAVDAESAFGPWRQSSVR